MIIYENSLKNHYILGFSNLSEFKKNGNFDKKSRQKLKKVIPLYKKGLEYIKSAKELFNELKLKEQYPILYGKIIILEIKIRCKINKHVEQNWTPALKEEIHVVYETMKKNNLFYLEILALQTIAEFMIKYTLQPFLRFF